jgi:hypothetical protein
MDTTRLILAIMILLLAAYIVAMNWGCVIVSIRNKRRGIDRHHSTVPVVSFILVALAHLIYPRPDKNWMIFIPLLDIANWSLLTLPFVLFQEWRKKNTEPGAPPNGGPAASVDNSNVPGGPPSVS